MTTAVSTSISLKAAVLVNPALQSEGRPATNGRTSAMKSAAGAIPAGGSIRRDGFADGFVAQALQTFRSIFRSKLAAAGSGLKHITRLTWCVAGNDVAGTKGRDAACREVFGRYLSAMPTTKTASLVERGLGGNRNNSRFARQVINPNRRGWIE